MELDIVRAWKDEEYRNGLSQEELAQLPEHPAGVLELSDTEVDAVNGAGDKKTVTYALICAQTLLVALCNSMGCD
jgi:mersacidin/lichenicidin family type 2 lantibiotic